MFNLNNFSIKSKLILVFVAFKIIPLVLLFGLGIVSFLEIEDLLKKNTSVIIKKSHDSIKNTTNSAILDSIQALDKKSQEMLEERTLTIANNVADFLKNRDKDLLFLAKQKINQQTLINFYNQNNSEVYIPINYIYDQQNKKWIPQDNFTYIKNTEVANLKDNSREFHKNSPKQIRKKLIPIYKEISFFNVKGKEIYKISSIDKNLKDISIKQNTYIKAEDYYEESLKLKKGEIYVSKVIGEYVPSPVIGTFNHINAAKADIAFEPEKYAYAGMENPVGKKFEGIIRFVTPSYTDDKLEGFISFALDHNHIMNFTDLINPFEATPLEISDASKGNYAFMWNSDFQAISHPRDYFIVGYDSKTGEMVPGWIDSDLATKFSQSAEKNLNAFLTKQPMFLNQSLNKKANLAQVKIGQIALDCRYLNFAPQCQGWEQLTNEGGYGSFIIFWNNVWKLSSAATIPYYTGQYKNSKRGFGFVTIGTNVAEFHKAATKTKKNVDKILDKEKRNIEDSIHSITKLIYNKIRDQINQMTLISIILLVMVIYIAIYISNNISNRIKSIIIGTQKIKDKDFSYQITSDINDEIGQLNDSFNTMAQSIDTLTKDLEQKIYIDDLTKLKNRNAYWDDVKKYTEPQLYLLDIDMFKNINDYYGTEAGNFILISFGNLLKEFAKKYKMEIYRIGSDEYILLRESKDDKTSVEKIIGELLKTINLTNFTDKDLNINTTLSCTCGISLGRGNLLEKADLALNEALRKKVSYMLYSESNPNMNKYKENIVWKQKIQYAITNDMVIPFFQQMINVKNPNNKKYEALMRIKDDNNYITPYYFLDIAKETKLYPELTKIMIEKTFKVFEKNNATCSLNLSIEDITNNEIVEFIDKKIEEYNLKGRIIFELLESEEIENFEEIYPFILKMKRQNIKFAIDDFGSGYSNFSYLLKIRPDLIKIDGSLIKNLTKDSNEYHIVDAIVKFAKTLDAKVVAEHVSSLEIVEVLKDFDIDFMQGFIYSEPSPNLSNI